MRAEVAQHPRSFVTVCRSGMGLGQQIAADFEIHPMTLPKWLRQAKVDGGIQSGVSSTESEKIDTSAIGSVAIHPVLATYFTVSFGS